MTSAITTRSVFIAGALAAAPLSLAATSEAVTEVVVSASRISAAPDLIPYSVTVVPAVGLTAHASLADALNDNVDFHVQMPGGRSGIATLFQRGADPNFTTVLFDGVPLNSSSDSRGGAVNVAAIDVASLERVELVSGPQSSLYGSGSLGGVINLVAPAGTRAHRVQATAGAGTVRDWTAALRWQGPMAGNLGASVGAVADDAGDQSAATGFRSRSLTVKIAPFDRADAGRLVARLSTADARSWPDASGGPRLAVRRTLEARTGREQLLGLSVPAVRGQLLRVDLSASWLRRRDATTSPGVAASTVDPVGIPAGTDHTRYQRTAAQAFARVDHAHWSLGGGLEAVRETGGNDGTLDFGGFRLANNYARERNTYSGLVEASRSRPAWIFNAAVRVDAVDGLDARVTARAGLRHVLGNGRYAVRVAAGSGFKAPSFYALGNAFVGNAKLRPEESGGAEAGLQWNGRDGNSAAITLFHTRFKSLVDFVPGPPPRLENRDRVTAQGVAITATIAPAPRWTTTSQLQYTRTRDAASGQQLLNRPQWRGNVALHWRASPALDLALRARHVGERDDYALPVGVRTLSANQQLSLEAAWAAGPGTTARLIVDNALDDQAETVLGLAAPGASARLSFTHTLQ